MKAPYEVRVDARVEREIRRVPAKDAERILDAIESLALNPHPPGSRKLVHQPGWRTRIGQYRVLYHIDEDNRVVTVYRAGHRREVYR